MLTIVVSIFKTKLGWVGVEGTSKGLTRLILPCRSKEKVSRLIVPAEGASARERRGRAARRSKNLWNEDDLIRCVKEDLISYLDGGRIRFDYPVDLDALSPFTVKVLKTVRTIPHGKTRSYSWVAGKVGGKQFARAVGRALPKNPLPIIIPCHRVVRNDGSIGGFGGGICLKKKLLACERRKLQVQQA